MTSSFLPLPPAPAPAPALASAFAFAFAFGLGVATDPVVTPVTKPAVVDTSLTRPDAHGVPRQPLKARPGGLAAVFFVTHDCPISNHYAPEIRRTCERYAGRGVTCSLIYVDPSLTDAGARAHARTYDLGTYSIIVDREHRFVRDTGAEIAPEVLVLTADGVIGYRGRIDDVFLAWGQSRRQLRTRDLHDALDALLSRTPVPRPETQPVGCIIGDLRRVARTPAR